MVKLKNILLEFSLNPKQKSVIVNNTMKFIGGLSTKIGLNKIDTYKLVTHFLTSNEVLSKFRK